MQPLTDTVLRRLRGAVLSKHDRYAGALIARRILAGVLFDEKAVPSWHRDAACAGMSTAAFYPAAGDYEAQHAAKGVCRNCPVRTECLADALRWEATGRRHGVLGGLSARQREHLAATGHPEHAQGGELLCAGTGM